VTKEEIVAEIQAARTELRLTTITNADYRRRVQSGHYAQRNLDPMKDTAWGRAYAHLDAAQNALLSDDPPIPPDVTLPTLEVFRAVLEPNNHETANDHLSGAWAKFTSPFTPLKAPNGDPPMRYNFLGDHFFVLKGTMYESGWPFRDINFHSYAVPGTGWETGVSPIARDSLDFRAESGHQVQWSLEYERTQDLDVGSPHSGGAHFGMPDGYAVYNEWHWDLLEVKLGRNSDGIFKVWDWKTGQNYINLMNVNTLAPGQTGICLWEGCYNSQSQNLRATGRILHTPALYGADPASCLRDTPTFVSSSVTTGPQSSAIQRNVQKIQVPSSPFLV
jgi:hypothetical protein